MRKIDWSKPLSDEDREWAVQFERLHPKIEKNDKQFGGKRELNRDERIQELRTTISSAQAEIARLEAEQAEEDNENRALVGDPATGNVIRDNTGVNGQRPEGAPTPAETYEGWTAERLKTEIKERNKEREEADLPPLSTSGSKAELTERLLADDREIAEAQGQ